MTKQNKTLSLSIFSGKGGVGKTNIALNLGYALFNAGHPTMLMDCDMGLANLDVLLGLSPERNIQDLLQPEVSAAEVLVNIEPPNFDFLPSASGVPELVEWDEDVQQALFQKLSAHFSSYDFLLLDLGAGINSSVLTMASMTRTKCMVISPEPTSLTDSYAVIKILSSKHGVQEFDVIVNMVENKKEGQTTFNRLNAACEKFLGLSLNLLGFIHEDKAVHESVRRQEPLLKFASSSHASRDILSLAAKLHVRRNKLLPQLADEPLLGEDLLQKV
jgi:flagellar biosynthesis protein FlhG